MRGLSRAMFIATLRSGRPWQLCAVLLLVLGTAGDLAASVRGCARARAAGYAADGAAAVALATAEGMTAGDAAEAPSGGDATGSVRACGAPAIATAAPTVNAFPSCVARSIVASAAEPNGPATSPPHRPPRA